MGQGASCALWLSSHGATLASVPGLRGISGKGLISVGPTDLLSVSLAPMGSVAHWRSSLWKEQDSRSQNQHTDLDREHPSHREAGHHKVPVFHNCAGAGLVSSGEFQAQACRNLFCFCLGM